MGAAELITEMVMPLGSTAFLSNGFVYTPMLLGFVFEGLALLAIYLVPLDTGIARSEEPLPTSVQQNNDQHPSQTSLKDAKGDRIKRLAGVLQEGGILTDARVITLLGCFALVKVGRQMLEMLVQYISERYGWSFAQASSFQDVDCTKLTIVGQHCIHRQSYWKLAPILDRSTSLEADPPGYFAFSSRPRRLSHRGDKQHMSDHRASLYGSCPQCLGVLRR